MSDDEEDSNDAAAAVISVAGQATPAPSKQHVGADDSRPRSRRVKPFRPPPSRACFPFTLVLGSAIQQQQVRVAHDEAVQRQQQTVLRALEGGEPLSRAPYTAAASTAVELNQQAIWYQCTTTVPFARTYPSS